MDIKTLSEILGHTNTNITLSYYVHSLHAVQEKTDEPAKISYGGFMIRNAFSSSFVYIPSAPGRIIPVRPDRFRAARQQKSTSICSRKKSIRKMINIKSLLLVSMAFSIGFFKNYASLYFFEYIKISPFIRSIFMKQSVYTGKGVGVVLLDTGIYPHMDFGDRIYAFADFISYRTFPYDDNGHGTCVAGILGGSGEASMGKYKGWHRGVL